MKHIYSLKRKLGTIGENDSIILYSSKGYVSLMRQIGAVQNRSPELSGLKCKKAQIIVDDKLLIGVYVYNY